PFCHTGVDGDPAERASRTAGFSPVKARLLELLAASDVFSAHPLHGVAVQAQRLVRALGVLLDVECGQKHAAFFDVALTEIINVIPHEIHTASHAVKLVSVIVSYANF